MNVTDLIEWRRRRAEARAVTSRHPCVTGGPHAELLDTVNRVLVPLGFRAGLWTRSARGTRQLAHVIRPLDPPVPGYARTRCGLTISPRRADPHVTPCRACFPS